MEKRFRTNREDKESSVVSHEENMCLSKSLSCWFLKAGPLSPQCHPTLLLLALNKLVYVADNQLPKRQLVTTFQPLKMFLFFWQIIISPNKLTFGGLSYAWQVMKVFQCVSDGHELKVKVWPMGMPKWLACPLPQRPQLTVSLTSMCRIWYTCESHSHLQTQVLVCSSQLSWKSNILAWNLFS